VAPGQGARGLAGRRAGGQPGARRDHGHAAPCRRPERAGRRDDDRRPRPVVHVATVERTRHAFERIDGTVEAVSTRIAEIAAAVEQIATEAHKAENDITDVAGLAEQSSAAAEQVSASTQQTSASTQQIASSASELAHTAEQLNQLVGRFRVSA
jgi:hypothetical protein